VLPTSRRALQRPQDQHRKAVSHFAITNDLAYRVYQEYVTSVT
jgi:hypothetical protein